MDRKNAFGRNSVVIRVEDWEWTLIKVEVFCFTVESELLILNFDSAVLFTEEDYPTKDSISFCWICLGEIDRPGT